jgi:hypothetical protein
VHKVLVKLDKDYADEFNVCGFSIMEQKQYDEMIKYGSKMINEDGELDKCFGTNESMMWDDAGDFKKSFTVKRITDQEAMTLENMFGTGDFGTSTPLLIHESVMSQWADREEGDE